MFTAPSRYFHQEHEIFREQVRSFVDKEIEPYIDQWEEERLFPKSVYRRMGELGFLGIRLPEEYGGSEGDIWMALVFCEELCRCHALGLPMSVLVHTDMSTTHIARYGTPQQKDKYLRPLISGEQVCAIAVSEPSGGSNVAGNSDHCGPGRGRVCPQWSQDFYHQLGPCRHLLCGGQNQQGSGP